jgi:putative flippase GtrA
MKKLVNRNFTLHKFLKYCLVGGSGAVISWMLLYTFTEWCHLWYMISAIITTFIVVTYNYLLNALWTFR